MQPDHFSSPAGKWSFLLLRWMPSHNDSTRDAFAEQEDLVLRRKLPHWVTRRRG